MDESAQDPGLKYSGWEDKDLDLSLPSCRYSSQGTDELNAKGQFPLCVRGLLHSTIEMVIKFVHI